MGTDTNLLRHRQVLYDADGNPVEAILTPEGYALVVTDPQIPALLAETNALLMQILEALGG